jgi:hypothetical protein
VHQGDALLIDRHPADKGLAFSRDRERQVSDPRTMGETGNYAELSAELRERNLLEKGALCQG